MCDANVGTSIWCSEIKHCGHSPLILTRSDRWFVPQNHLGDFMHFAPLAMPGLTANVSYGWLQG